MPHRKQDRPHLNICGGAGQACGAGAPAWAGRGGGSARPSSARVPRAARLARPRPPAGLAATRLHKIVVVGVVRRRAASRPAWAVLCTAAVGGACGRAWAAGEGHSAMRLGCLHDIMRLARAQLTRTALRCKAHPAPLGSPGRSQESVASRHFFLSSSKASAGQPKSLPPGHISSLSQAQSAVQPSLASQGPVPSAPQQSEAGAAGRGQGRRVSAGEGVQPGLPSLAAWRMPAAAECKGRSARSAVRCSWLPGLPVQPLGTATQLQPRAQALTRAALCLGPAHSGVWLHPGGAFGRADRAGDDAARRRGGGAELGLVAGAGVVAGAVFGAVVGVGAVVEAVLVARLLPPPALVVGAFELQGAELEAGGGVGDALGERAGVGRDRAGAVGVEVALVGASPDQLPGGGWQEGGGGSVGAECATRPPPRGIAGGRWTARCPAAPAAVCTRVGQPAATQLAPAARLPPTPSSRRCRPRR